LYNPKIAGRGYFRPVPFFILLGITRVLYKKQDIREINEIEAFTAKFRFTSRFKQIVQNHQKQGKEKR